MSVTDRPSEQDVSAEDVDLSNLGTVPARELEADRGDAELQAESRAALEAMAALERAGRLIVG